MPGAPTGALLCRYEGLPEPGVAIPGGALIGQERLSAAGARALARDFDALAPAPRGARSCPSDEGASAMVLFGYRSGPDARISVSLQGCTGSFNGILARESFPARLLRLRAGAGFLRAHEATVSGRVCLASRRPTCVAPRLAHLSIQVISGRLWSAQPPVRHGRFRSRVLPGVQHLHAVEDELSGGGTTLGSLTLSVRAGRVAHPVLWVR